MTARTAISPDLDQFVRQDGQWLFAERRLMVNWIDTRPSSAAVSP